MFQSSIGMHRLVARSNDRRILILDPAATFFWDLLQQGWTRIELLELINENDLTDSAEAAQTIDYLISFLGESSYYDGADPSASWRFGINDDAGIIFSHSLTSPDRCLVIDIADRTLSLKVEDPALLIRLKPLIRSILCSRAQVHHLLELKGTGPWQLQLNHKTEAEISNIDEALVATLELISNMGCMAEERLLVLHGAGVVAPGGQALLLVAPGGNGKSTLTTALEARGYDVLSDDVVPVSITGQLLGLGLPITLKEGSWPVLEEIRQDLMFQQVVERHGQTVRLLPLNRPSFLSSARCVYLLLTRYAPNEPTLIERISSIDAFVDIVQGGAVIRELNQVKLQAISDWLSSVSTFRLHYPDLTSAISSIELLINGH